MAQNASLVGQAYNYFIGRDLAYLTAGALLLGVADFAVFDGAHLPREFSVLLAGFLLLSYFVGLSVSEASHLIPLTPKGSEEMKAGYDDALVAYSEIEKKYTVGVVNRHERTVILMHVGASFGPCSLIASLVMVAAHYLRSTFPRADQIDPADFWLVTAALFLYGAFMIGYSRWKLKQVGEQRSALLK